MRITAIKVDELKSINGGELNIDPSTPMGAVAEFYRAYNNHDLSLMELNWLTSADISMNNPIEGIRRGWPEIRHFYEKIFASPSSVRVEFYDYTIFHCESAFLAVGRERGLSHSIKTTLALQSQTSRF